MKQKRHMSLAQTEHIIFNNMYMTGYLIVNTFMNKDKFLNLYKLLGEAFSRRGVNLEIKRAEDLSLEVGGVGINKPDFILFWDKDIYLAERLESLGIRLFNRARAIELSDNKILMYQELKKKGIRIPRTFIAPKTFEGLGYSSLDFLSKIEKELSYPMVVKEAYGSFGQQVYLASNHEEMINIISKIGYKDFLIQEYILSSKGRDVRLNVVGDQVIVSMLRENKNDFRSNIASGGSGQAYEPSEEFKKLAIKASKALGLDFAGVDIMFDENNSPILCEVNSNPQFASTLKIAGVNLADYIVEHILKSL